MRLVNGYGEEVSAGVDPNPPPPPPQPSTSTPTPKILTDFEKYCLEPAGSNLRQRLVPHPQIVGQMMEVGLIQFGGLTKFEEIAIRVFCAQGGRGGPGAILVIVETAEQLLRVLYKHQRQILGRPE